MKTLRSRWQSVDTKLPLLASGLVLATATVLGLSAHALLKRALVDAAGRRLFSSATLVASLVNRPATLTDSASRAADAALRAFARGQRGPAARAAAMSALSRRNAPLDTSKVFAALLSSSGEPLLTYARANASPKWPAQAAAAGAIRGDSMTLGPVEGLGGIATYTLAHALRACTERSECDSGSAAPLGYVFETRRILGRNVAMFRSIIGPGVEMLVGQPGVGAWTDLEHIAGAPPVQVSADSIIAFDGGVGTTRRVAGTNWVVWLSQPSELILAPATALLWSVLPLGLIIAFVAAALMFRMARRITHPVVELTAAVEQIARDAKLGESGRHAATGEYARDELARLRTAVERMARRLEERAELEEQLRQAQKMDAIGRLAGGVAHDFNNLLTAIRSYADLILDDMQVWDSKRADVMEIRAAADRAAALTAQLLAFSRKSMLQPRVLDSRAVLTQLQPMLRRLVAEDIGFILEASSDLWPVHADRGQLEQVIINLVVNARDAMPRGGTLTIAASNLSLPQPTIVRGDPVPAGEYVVVRVSDTGLGMDADTQRQAFEPFFTTKELGQGTGLGLASVDGIVGQSGGFVDIRSAVSQGTTVTVYLRRADEPPDVEVTAGPEFEHGQCGTVLLVEDEPAVRTLAQRVLTRAGYRVLECATPSDAIRAAGEHKGDIALLLTDVVMPEMNGPALASRISKMCPYASVLYISGYADDEVIGRGLDSARSQLLPKPFSAQQLVERVRNAIERA